MERDRRKREAGLLLLLLLLAGRARLFIVRAIHVGAPWTNILRGVLLGNDSIDQPGGVRTLARAMADSHIAGYQRVGRLLGIEMPDLAGVGGASAMESLATAYTGAARQQLGRVANSLEGAVTARLAEVADADRITADTGAVNEAFERAGWAKLDPFDTDLAENARRSAAAEATAAVLRAYGAGMHEGYQAPPVTDVLTALRFTAVIDERTTTICRARDGVTLPLDSPWFFRNYPPLHFNCRSVVLPLRRQVEFTADPPDFPLPAEGFGSYSGMLVGGVWDR